MLLTIARLTIYVRLIPTLIFESWGGKKQKQKQQEQQQQQRTENQTIIQRLIFIFFPNTYNINPCMGQHMQIL